MSGGKAPKAFLVDNATCRDALPSSLSRRWRVRVPA